MNASGYASGMRPALHLAKHGRTDVRTKKLLTAVINLPGPYHARRYEISPNWSEK